MGSYRSLRVVAGHVRLLRVFYNQQFGRQYTTMNFEGLANEKIGTTGKPPFIYGTAWKKEDSTRLVTEALSAGFRAIDTAAQPKHYREDLVGDALRDCFEHGIVKREQLFVRNTFMPRSNLQLLTITRSKPNSHLPMAKTRATCHMTIQPLSNNKSTHL